MSRGYDPAGDAWVSNRCTRPSCRHLRSQHHGDGGECLWCKDMCAAYVAPTEDFLSGVAATRQAHQDTYGGDAA